MLAKAASFVAVERVDGGESSLRFAMDTRFLKEFADRGLVDRLPGLDLATGKPQRPASGGLARRTSSTRPSRTTTVIVAAIGRPTGETVWRSGFVGVIAASFKRPAKERRQTRPFAGLIRIRFKGSLRCVCQQYLSPLAGHRKG